MKFSLNTQYLFYLYCIVSHTLFGFLLSRLCGFEPFFDDRGDQAMFQRILKCDYEFVSPWWDEVSDSAKVCTVGGRVSSSGMKYLIVPRYVLLDCGRECSGIKYDTNSSGMNYQPTHLTTNCLSQNLF